MISVVIPLYNKEKSVRATLESVLAQTYTDYEVIIVNDGSTDNSVAVCEDIINLLTPSFDNSLRIFSKPNGGVSSARNFGVEKSRGEYVAFLDADDKWAPDYLETMARLIEDYPQAVMYGLGFAWIYPNGKEVPASCAENFRGIIPNDGSWLVKFWTGSTCCRKSDMLKAGLFNTRLTHGEDLDMWWRLMLSGDVAFDSHKCAYYRQDAENRAMAQVPPIEKHVVSIIDQYAKARKQNADFRKAFDTQMIYFLYPYLFTSYKKEALRLAEQLDYMQLKKTLQFRMKFPHIYRMYERAKELGTKEI
jgi:glycosyltransferase involved in cell wall biosynthesis